MRYVNLSTVLVFRLVSTKVKRRFPDYESLVEAKLMLRKEVKQMENAEMLTPHEATWTPILWALKLLERARSEKKIQVNVSKIIADTYINYDSDISFRLKHLYIQI